MIATIYIYIYNIVIKPTGNLHESGVNWSDLERFAPKTWYVYTLEDAEGKQIPV